MKPEQLICISFKETKKQVQIQKQNYVTKTKKQVISESLKILVQPKSRLILTKVKAYFRHLLCAISACNCPFEIFTLQTLSVCMLFRGVSSLNCPKLTKISPFLFIPHAWSAFLKYALKDRFPFFSAEFFNLQKAASVWF